MRQPVFAEHALVDLKKPLFLNRLEPDELKIEVVVRRGIALEILRVEVDVKKFQLAFIRSAERPADVFSGPAAENLVTVDFAVQETFPWFIHMKHTDSFRLILRCCREF